MVEQLNIEYFFRLFYNCLRGGCHTGTANYAALAAFLAHLWLWIIVLGYAIAVAGLILIVYETMRLFELRARENAALGELILAPSAAAENPRWKHIGALAEGASPSEWREAIIEADIMLDDLLTRQGYAGDGVGEKLRAADPADFATLDDAWEAHKVRNQIAHEGSAFDLSEGLAARTIARYEAVFREFGVI